MAIVVLAGEPIFVAVQPLPTIDLGPSHSAESVQLRLPEGASPVGVADIVRNAAQETTATLQAMIRGIGKSIVTAANDLGPAEWTAEFSVGFKGEANPIPFLATAGGEAAIKIILKWKK